MLLVIIVLGVIIYFLLNKPEEKDERDISEGLVVGEVDEKAANATFTTDMNMIWNFPSGSAVSTNAQIGNSTSNLYECYFELFLDDEEQTLLYSSPVLPVGKRLDKLELNEVLNVGEAFEKLQYALSFSREKRIIIEEYVENFGYQVAGDGFSVDGELVFRCFANDHFNSNCINPFVPVSASFPYNMPQEIHNKIHKEIQRLLTILHMKTTAYNFDIRIDKEYNVYLMEIAPRNGGNYIPQVIRYATGVDLVESTVKAALGEAVNIPKNHSSNGFWSYYAVHSVKEGILDGVEIDREVLAHNIVENHLIKKAGEKINTFLGANDTLGCLIMRFDSMGNMLDMMEHSEKWCQVRVK